MQKEIKLGMYVRCPIDKEYPDNPRRFILGQVIDIDYFENIVTVEFHDMDKIGMVFDVPKTDDYSLDEVTHNEILKNSKAVITSSLKEGIILGKAFVQEGPFYNYYVQTVQRGRKSIEQISEYDLTVSFVNSNINPVIQMKNYEFNNPIWYQYRQIVANSVHTLQNATFGFETLVGSRVFLLPHQVDTIVRAISESPCRFMLADEVGLGKTIQAAVIKKGLQKRFGDLRVLIIAPESLVHQWKNELSYKFWENTKIWNEEMGSIPDEIIIPLEKISSAGGKGVLHQSWDLCIVDETHRLTRMEDEYKAIFALSKNVEHLLLLSATPIQSRQTEFLKLLCLLEPKKYGDMPESHFAELLEKQSFLSGKIHAMIRDIDDYYDDELAEDYVDDLDEIAEKLNDTVFDKIVSEIDIHSDDEGYEKVLLALAYIGEHYQLERKVIRHRRKELNDKLPSRSIDVCSYWMQGAGEGFYESETYEDLLAYLEEISDKYSSREETALYIRLFLSAMFSSPWALTGLVKQRVNKLNQKKEIRTGNAPVLPDLPLLKDESKWMKPLATNLNKWTQAVKDEFERIEELYDDPDLIKGRLMCVVDYLNQSVDEKYIIFTSWTDTAVRFKERLEQIFGKESVTGFYKGMDEEELQQSVDEFQNNPKCRMLVSDELGGEGRNFQMADEVIHIDLPWSPSMLEQRIGRLDRIGRDKEVISVVFFAEETIEEELFKLWDEGLNIFNESLSGLEIALGDIEDNINKALLTNIRYGLTEVLSDMQQSLEDMRKKVDQERYFDIARQLDASIQEQLLSLIDKFDSGLLGETMMSWSSLVGFRGRPAENEQVLIFDKDYVNIRGMIKSMKNTMFVPPMMKEYHKRAEKAGEVRGTFNRELAVKRENLGFFAPGNTFFDAIVNNAYGSELGRCCAFMRKGAPVNWKGFVFTWSVNINSKYLLQENENLEYLFSAQGYMPLDHIMTVEGLTTEDDDDIDLTMLKEQINRHDRAIHLGERKTNRFVEFQNLFPKDEWISRVEEAYQNNYQNMNMRVKKMIDLDRAERDLQRRVDAIRASNLYYKRVNTEEEQKIIHLQVIYDKVLEGLREPEIVLESIAFVWLVND
jgi:ATP-dependent helicase HepA